MRDIGRFAWLTGAFALTIPGLVFKFGGLHASPPVEALIFGFGVLGASFLLSWAAEIAQLEMSQALALALLALIAILPEYAVDLYFAWRAAEDPIYGQYAAANMTGANRLLVGLGLPVIVWLYWLRWRQPKVRLGPSDQMAAGFLGILVSNWTEASGYAVAIALLLYIFGDVLTGFLLRPGLETALHQLGIQQRREFHGVKRVKPEV